MKVGLLDVLDGSFKFYLEDNFRQDVFTGLKEKYKDWRLVAKALDIETRNLFSIRRGYEFLDGKKVERFLSSKHVINIHKTLGISMEEIEANIIKIKLGFGGLQEKIRLPLNVNLESDVESIGRSLADYMYTKGERVNNFDAIPKNFTRNKFVEFKIKITPDKMKSLRLRGLRPELCESQDVYLISYRNPGTDYRVEKTLPKIVIFNETFAKQFGKWLGDRCGGPNKVGVGNKQWEFVNSFNKFLQKELKQPKNNIEILLTCKDGFNPPHEIQEKVSKIEYKNSQYGNYAYRTEVSNKLLRDLIFNEIENNIFNLLLNSSPSVVYSFYAGLFEAEGSIIMGSKNICLAASGLNLGTEHTNEEIISRLNNAVNHKYILSRFGINSRISRKVARTELSSTIKYDIILLSSETSRKKEFKYLKNSIIPYITHPIKLNKIKSLEVIIFNQTSKMKQKNDEKLLPEINIGLVGHD